MIRQIRTGWRALVLSGVLLLVLATGVAAQEVVVQRHVTIRQAPDKSAQVVDFPRIGSVLTLLDGGAKTKGYYHIALADGRTGFVYSTFVKPGASFIAAAPLPDDRIAVHYIDVDQGAAALIEFPCAAVMIDTGGRGDAASRHLLAYLDAFFARRQDLNRRLEAIYITHTHVDHNSNLKAVAQRYGVGTYIHNGVLTGSGRTAARWMVGYPPKVAAFAASTKPQIKTKAISTAEVIAAGGQGLSDAVIDPVSCPRVDPKISILSARYDEDPGWPGGEIDNGNNQSLVIRIDYGEASFLFPGDLEEPAIETMVDRYAGGAALDVDVLQAGHHGSYNGTTASLLEATSPQAIVISAGDPAIQEKWTAYAYGHPRRSLVTMLEAGVSGSRPAPKTVLVADKVKQFSPYTMKGAVYATSWDRDLTISAGPNGVLAIETGR